MDPAPFLRGNPFAATGRVPYPRAKPGDTRIPGDTWYTATFPAGVRLALVGDGEVRLNYECARDDLAWQGTGGRSFEAWAGDERVGAASASLGGGTVVLPVRGRTDIHLPERLGPRVTAIEVTDGTVEPAPKGPRWLCYGDSIAEGWVASSPGLAWPARVARAHDLDVANMAYAGAARGEIVSAEHLAVLEADVISITHGTNCWNRIPFSESLMRESTIAFLRVVRTGHPRTPIVVCSPPLRPEAENTPNALGATLIHLRGAMADAAKAFDGVVFVDGAGLITADMLADNVHPNDEGHAAIARALGPVIAEAARGA